MAEQRLPKVNQDDGTWGDILRQYLKKEHIDDGTDNAANGGHQHITITASDGTAGTAPITLTSGTLLSAPAIGAIEFNNDTLYFTKTTGTTRMQVVMDTATQTLTNKTLTSPAISAPTFSGSYSFGGTPTWPTFNQTTTGSAATLTTARTFQTNLASTSTASFNGSANVTPGVTGTLPVANGGTGRATSTTIYGLIAAGTTATGPQQTIAPGTAGQFLKSAGGSALATFASIAQSDVTNLTTDLAGKAATSHTHTASQISDSTAVGRAVLVATDAATARTVIGAGTASTKADVGLGSVDNTSDATKNSAAVTLSNKRIDPRVVSPTVASSYTINVDVTDLYNVSGQSSNVTFNNPTGTPVNGQKMMVRIKDDGTPRLVGWGSNFQASGITGPIAQTVPNKEHNVLFVYSAGVSKWVCLAADTVGY